MSDEKRVLVYILKNGSITTADAFRSLGISRLSGRVYDLRSKGIPIAGERVKVERRDGKPAYVTRYFLPHDVVKEMDVEGILNGRG